MQQIESQWRHDRAPTGDKREINIRKDGTLQTNTIQTDHTHDISLRQTALPIYISLTKSVQYSNAYIYLSYC